MQPPAAGPLPPGRETLRGRLRPRDRRKRRKRHNAELRAPSAPLSSSSRRPPQRAGSRLAFMLASSWAPNDARSSPGGSAPPPTPGLRRAPRAARRLCRVSSGGGDARSHVSRPRLGGRRGSGRPEEVYGRAQLPRRGAAPPRAAPQRPAPRCSLSRRRPRAARRRVRVAPSRRSPRARPAFLPPPPSSVPVCPGASPSPGALALGGAKGADRSPLAAPAPLPQDAWAASARTSLRSSRLGASYTSRTGGGRREGPGEKTGGTARPWPAGPSRGRCGRAGRVQMGEGRIPKLRRSRSCSPSATPKDMRVLRGAAQKEVDPLRSSRLDSS